MSLHSRRWVRCLALAAATMAVGACGKQASGDATAATPAGSMVMADAAPAQSTQPTPDSHSLCRLLTDAEVRAVFPGAGKGVPERTREKYGITACVWSGDFGRFAVQTWKGEGNSADEEARGLATGFIDPLDRKAAGNVRYESVAGVGDQATAVLETRDAQRGILTNVAMLVALKQDDMLVLLADDLAQRNRADALAKLRLLAGSAARRL